MTTSTAGGEGALKNSTAVHNDYNKADESLWLAGPGRKYRYYLPTRYTVDLLSTGFCLKVMLATIKNQLKSAIRGSGKPVQKLNLNPSCPTRALTEVLVMTPNVDDVKFASGFANCG